MNRFSYYCMVKIPLCESDTQKTQLEDEVLRSLMTTAVSKKMDSKGFDTEDYKTKAREGLVKSILNLFDVRPNVGSMPLCDVQIF